MGVERTGTAGAGVGVGIGLTFWGFDLPRMYRRKNGASLVSVIIQ